MAAPAFQLVTDTPSLVKRLADVEARMPAHIGQTRVNVLPHGRGAQVSAWTYRNPTSVAMVDVTEVAPGKYRVARHGGEQDPDILPLLQRRVRYLLD